MYFTNQSVRDMEAAHQEQQNSVQIELKKEMALLQKKILTETVYNIYPQFIY